MKKTNRRSKQSSPVVASPPNEKQLYEERIRELERQNKAYQVENEELRQQLTRDSSAPNTGVEKLKQDYLQKLNLLEQQVAELKKKSNTQSQFSTQSKRVDQSQFEIERLKAQKVQLQCKIKLDSVQFRIFKALQEKEILQLKKERRRDGYEIQKLLASSQRLKMVLQRKTEEASMATKRLRELIESRKAIQNRNSGARKVDDKVQAVDHELEVSTQLHELCSQYESQIEEMAEEIEKLKEDAEMQRQENLRSQSQDESSDCLKKNSDIDDLKEQVNDLSCRLRELQLQKGKLNPKDKMQNLVRPLFSDGTHDKVEERMNTPEMNHSSETEAKKDKSEGLCCSCTKKSLCKTGKCICRSKGGSCGTSCGCSRFKCTNRELNTVAEDEPPKSDHSIKNVTPIEIAEDGNVITCEGAKLLQNALAEKPEVGNKQRRRKKPLCDIQNSLSLDALDGRKAGKKKNLRKPVIQLVTKDSHSSLPESIKTPDEVHSSEI